MLKKHYENIFSGGRAGSAGIANVLSLKTQFSLYGSSQNIWQVPKSQWTQENYLLLSKANFQWYIDLLLSKVYNVLESPPLNHTKLRKGKKKNQFRKFWYKLHAIQSTLWHLFYIDVTLLKMSFLPSLLSKEINSGNISEMLSRKILTDSGWPQVCVSCFCCHGQPSFCPGYQHKRTWGNCIFGNHPVEWNPMHCLERIGSPN